MAEAEKRSSSEDVFSSPRMLHGGDGTERFATSTSDGGRIKCKGGSRRDGGANVGGGKRGKGGKGGNGATSESLTLFGLFWGGGDKREKSMKERKGREAAAGRVAVQRYGRRTRSSARPNPTGLYSTAVRWGVARVEVERQRQGSLYPH